MTQSDLPPHPPQSPSSAQPPYRPQTWYQVPARPPGRRATALLLVTAALVGAAAGYSAIALASRARAYCDAGWEAGGRFEMTFLLVLMVPGCAFLALLIAFLSRQLPLPLRPVPSLLVLALVVLLFFATKGTLDGYPGNLERCGLDNVPPWWPGWLPA
ncbi:hypothetical protein [Streptomyces sp. NBC_01233]|uniref:hypothetical protein n=1 Tax=Streptomyces sp. NBC_01233 TaxID=2903787 RepID=UPI002E12658C|nr:hypothetical protein OG332_33520 [Streptomyces sp. NBC_01233]